PRSSSASQPLPSTRSMHGSRAWSRPPRSPSCSPTEPRAGQGFAATSSRTARGQVSRRRFLLGSSRAADGIGRAGGPRLAHFAAELVLDVGADDVLEILFRLEAERQRALSG